MVAVSFTRAATWNLWRRVQRVWGPAALAWPHRIVTLDTIMWDLVHDLLSQQLITWPNRHQQLEVHDSWTAFSGTTWTRTAYALRVTPDGVVEIRTGFTSGRSARVPSTEIVPRLAAAVCTHEDVRSVLQQALALPRCLTRVQERLARTVRSLIVDEVFDANDLDINVVELAINAGVSVTMVGDPWQALYVFRGARPDVVPQMLARTSARTFQLTRSFRWTDPAQEELARRLRVGEQVLLALDTNGGADVGVDVVLALFWKPLWEVGQQVMPVAFHSFKGGNEEAAATLVLNHVTRKVFSEDATYLGAALSCLAITDPEIPRQLEPDLQRIVDTLRTPGAGAVTAAYKDLVEVIAKVSERPLRRAHAAHTGRLAQLASRLIYPAQLVPGLTTHQAKGREWDIVGVRLSDTERAALAAGLRIGEDAHRKLYVACTRARHATVEV